MLDDAKDKIWSEIQVPYVMLIVFNDDYVSKLLILTLGRSSLRIQGEIIFLNWPRNYIEGLELFYQTSFLGMRINFLLM